MIEFLLGLLLLFAPTPIDTDFDFDRYKAEQSVETAMIDAEFKARREHNLLLENIITKLVINGGK